MHHVSTSYSSIERTSDRWSNSFVSVAILDVFRIVWGDLTTSMASPIRYTISSDELLLLVSFPPRYIKLSTCCNATLLTESLITWFCNENHCISVLAALTCSLILLPSQCILLTNVCKSSLDSARVAMSSAKRRLLMVFHPISHSFHHHFKLDVEEHWWQKASLKYPN